MLTEYIHAAMHRATYEILSDGTFYGEIPRLPGRVCERRDARSVLRAVARGFGRVDCIGPAYGALVARC
jgi:hypothetical protein